MAASMRNPRENSTTDGLVENHSPHKIAFSQSPVTTPRHSPKNMTLKITQVQKQALIDNLQSEVTERARKLRAQYALQAQNLLFRIELRIKRIPTSLLKANMGELFAKYQEVKAQEQSNAAVEKDALITMEQTPPEDQPDSAPSQLSKKMNPTSTKGPKRKSDEMEGSGKENASDPNHPLPNPKKRTKLTARQASRQAPNPSTVLSPKSSNSRTLRQPPTQITYDSPLKANLSRPTSPFKPSMPPKLAVPAQSTAAAPTLNKVSVVVGKSKSTREKASILGRNAGNTQAPKPISKPAVTRPKRGVNNIPPETRSVSNTSNTSATSTGTTIMRKGGKAAVAGAPQANKSKAVKPSARATAKKAAPVVEGPPPGRRVLRKRA